MALNFTTWRSRGGANQIFSTVSTSYLILAGVLIRFHGLLTAILNIQIPILMIQMTTNVNERSVSSPKTISYALAMLIRAISAWRSTKSAQKEDLWSEKSDWTTAQDLLWIICSLKALANPPGTSIFPPQIG